MVAVPPLLCYNDNMSIFDLYVRDGAKYAFKLSPGSTPILNYGRAATKDTVLATNLFKDPVLAGGTAAWSMSGGTIAVGTEGGIKVTNTGTGYAIATSTTNTLSGLSGGTLYVSVDVRGTGTSGVAVQFMQVDANGTNLGNAASYLGAPTAGWTRTTFAIALNAATVRSNNFQLIRSSGGAAGDYVEWRNVKVSTVNDPTFFYGGTVDNTYTYRWTGTPNASTSQKLANSLTIVNRTSTQSLPLVAGESAPLTIGSGTALTLSDTFSMPLTVELCYVPTKDPAGTILQNGPLSVYESGGVLMAAVSGQTVEIEWDREQSHIAVVLNKQSLALQCNGVRTVTDIPDGTNIQLTGAFTLQPLAGSIDALAVYDFTINADILNEHYSEMRDVPLNDEVLSSLVPADTTIPVYQGAAPDEDDTTPGTSQPYMYFMGSDNERNVSDIYRYTIDDDFLGGVAIGTVVSGDSVTGTGTWTVSVPISTNPKLEWDSDGAVNVDISMDGGATWVAATNNHTVTTAAVDGIGTMDIRATLTNATLRSLTVTMYIDQTLLATPNNRTVTLSANVSTASDDNQPIEQNPLAGVTVPNGGVVTIAADPDGNTVSTVSFWIKQDTLSNGTLLTAGVPITINAGVITGATVYINGESNSTLVAGKWSNVVVTNLPPTAAAVTITPSNAQISAVTLMQKSLTAADAKYIYGCYFGYPTTSVVETSATITEPADAYSFIQSDWSITSSY